MLSRKYTTCISAALLSLALSACCSDTRPYHGIPYCCDRTAGSGIEYYCAPSQRMAAIEEPAPPNIEPAAGDPDVRQGDQVFYEAGHK